MDNPGPALPSNAGRVGPGESENPPVIRPVLSDVIGKDRSLNVFAGLVRDVEPVLRRLDNSCQNSTVLAPLNSAMDKLTRKPWEDPEDYNKLGAGAYEGDSGWERAQRNIRSFVEAHVVPQNPWKEGEKVKALGEDGTEIWWEETGGRMVLQPGNIEVASIENSVQNGEVWKLKSVRTNF